MDERDDYVELDRPPPFGDASWWREVLGNALVATALVGLALVMIGIAAVALTRVHCTPDPKWPPHDFVEMSANLTSR